MDTLELDLHVPLRAFALDVRLTVGRETLAVVGPSGAGKSTLLRAVAGLVRPERGRVALGGRTLLDRAAKVDVPPEERRVGYVFQDYALFPHMTVSQNVAYAGGGRARELLRRFGIDHLAHARPRDLSGGERQRVGLARALARDPEVLLLDEPLSALDTHTRVVLRAELHALLRELDLPALLVTHDFHDAAALADRVGVLVRGRLLQLGTADEIVRAPATPFVAGFAGGNVLHGAAVGTVDGLTEVRLATGETVFSTDAASGHVGVVVYPWDVSIAREAPAGSALNALRGRIGSVVAVGNRVRVQIGPVVGEITAASAERLELQPGEEAVASFKATSTRLAREPG